MLEWNVVLLLIVFLILSSAFKAKFQAQITVPETFTVLFNTKELSVTTKNGMRTYLFEQTPGTHLFQAIGHFFEFSIVSCLCVL
jgi:hypothetical protein